LSNTDLDIKKNPQTHKIPGNDELYPNKMTNIVNNLKASNSKESKELIQQILNSEHLRKLKTLIINNPNQPFSISKKILGTKLNTNSNNIHKLQEKIKSLKQEIKHIKGNLQQEDIISLIQNQTDKGEKFTTTSDSPPFSLNKINISTIQPPNPKLISTIEKFNYQKWFIFITLIIDNSKVTFTAMIDSGADHSVIRDGIFPTKYYEPTKENLIAANNSPLKVMGKITKILICNKKICFKHQFIVVDNLNTDIILGIPFLTQIYPFWIDSKGLSTKIIG